MAAGKSDYLEAKLLEHVLKNTAYTSPTTVYAALFQSGPNDAGVGTEVPNTNGYQRTAITFGSASSPAGSIANSAAVTFPAATGSGWGTITGMGIYDSGTYGAGNLLYYNDTISSRTVLLNDVYEFPIGAITVTEG